MSRLPSVALAIAVLVRVPAGAAHAAPAIDYGPGLAPKEYEVTRLADGVYAFVWTRPLQNPIEGNALFIINDDDVVVVDAGLWPTTARAMAAELKKLTGKPVRVLVNTHWHDDHHNGNFIYREMWPGLTIINQRDTRADMFTGTYQRRADNLENARTSAAKFQRWADTGMDDDGTPLEDGRRRRARELAALFRRMIPEMVATKDAAADVTFDDHLVLYRGSRTIELQWLGRGNTRGDTVVFLPKERIAATGDLLVGPAPFGFGSYYAEWIETLGKLDRLDATVLVPGHGPVMRDRAYLHQVQGLLGDLVKQVKEAVANGATLDETKQRVKLADWRVRFAGQDEAAGLSFERNFLEPAVERAWYQARGEQP